MIGDVLTWTGRIWSAIFLLGVLVFFGCLAYGAWWDRRQRRDVRKVRALAAALSDEPDPAWVERTREWVVAEVREGGWVR